MIRYKTYDEAMEAVKKDGFNLQYVSANLRKEEKIVFAAVEETGLALQFASKNMKDKKAIVLKAVENCQYTGYSEEFYPLFHASERLKADRDVVLASIKKSYVPLVLASPTLKEDKVLIRGIMQQSVWQAVSFMSDKLKTDTDILCALAEIDAENLTHVKEFLGDLPSETISKLIMTRLESAVFFKMSVLCENEVFNTLLDAVKKSEYAKNMEETLKNGFAEEVIQDLFELIKQNLRTYSPLKVRIEEREKEY